MLGNNLPLFKNRQTAGQQLAQALLCLHLQHPVVLALPRGGVPLGFGITRSLQAPLDILLVRKIGVPGMPEPEPVSLHGIRLEQPHLFDARQARKKGGRFTFCAPTYTYLAVISPSTFATYAFARLG